MKRYYWEFSRYGSCKCVIYDRRLGFEFGRLGEVVNADIATTIVDALNAMVAS